ncbi:MAG: neutral zinc metallopeptidase [Acidobacteria bacterium]|nr:neutral zinc metallopeptidase [Acidobacteriota bacterium]
MRWQIGRRSTNVEDRRGMSVPRAGGIGCLGLVIIVALAYLTGSNPLELLQQVGTDTSISSQGPATIPGTNDTSRQFVEVVLGSTEDAWTRIFSEAGRQYRIPKLVLFENAISSACGFNSAAVGPFYCSPDETVYLDLSFFEQLDRQFGAPGDFAQAYVIAHEVGHHVQNLLGIMDQIDGLRRRANETESNALTVLLELQADCFAGVWGCHAKDQNLLEPGDIEEGLQAAQSIGDDLIQKRSQGYVNPDSFTHGTSAQRSYWFRRGLETGRVDACSIDAIAR